MSEKSGDPDPRGLFAMNYVYLACPVEPGTLRVFNWGEIAKQRFYDEPVSLGFTPLNCSKGAPEGIQLGSYILSAIFTPPAQWNAIFLLFHRGEI